VAALAASPFAALVRRRRMTRTFDTRPVAPALVEELADLASRAPSAGKTQGWHLVVLEGPGTARFWDATLPAERRAGFAFPGLLAAPLLAVAVAEPEAYVARYSEADKAATGLGAGPDAWPVPYWTVDASMAVMTFLLAAEEAGLGALFFGVFHGEDQVRAALGIDARHQIIGAIALGWPAADERRGRSAGRARRSTGERIRRP
jgi:nitroreductase